MSDDYPFRPDGSGDEAHFHQKMHGHTFGPGSKLRNSSTVKWHKTADGIFATVKVPRSNGGSDISVYQVQSVPSGTDDYFSAMAYDFTDDSTSGDAVNIALPWELRNAQKPAGAALSPAYAVDDIVFVLETDDGENGVMVSGDELALMDLALGRTWVSPSLNYRGTYSGTTAYNPGDVVRVQSGSSQGVWIRVGSGSTTGTAPVFPEPVTTGGTNTWDMWAFGIEATNVCASGSKTMYINASPPM